MSMYRSFLFLLLSFLFHSLRAQHISSQLQQAVKEVESDIHMKYGMLAFQVIEAASGKVVYSHNAHTGLPVASSQKVITSIASFELLSDAYRFKTKLGYSGKLSNGNLDGDIVITGEGDPTLGSWRWKSVTDTATVLKAWVAAIMKAGIQSVHGEILIPANLFSNQRIPDGWIWQDIGNYYGAGAGAINWNENQYDIFLQSGNSVGDKVQLQDQDDRVEAGPYLNELVTASKGTGDNAYIYLPVGDTPALLLGTIPAGEKKFPISGALPCPECQLKSDFRRALASKGVEITGTEKTRVDEKISELAVHHSPSLDSINYWFLKRSINLYGEALVKAIALEKTGYASTERGLSVIKKFWTEHGIDSGAINIQDGSGLSPLNRVTAAALADVMKYARSQAWYASFLQALPEYNGIRMKSGTIGGVKSFTGYVKSKAGTEYVFAIIASNYNGSSSAMVNRLYRILNVLK